MTIHWLRFGIAAAFILGGLFVLLTAVIGNFKFKFVLSRMQAAAAGDTLGLLFMLTGLIILSGLNFTSLKMAVIIVFLWLSSPVASHMLVRLELSTSEELKGKVEELNDGDY